MRTLLKDAGGGAAGAYVLVIAYLLLAASVGALIFKVLSGPAVERAVIERPAERAERLCSEAGGEWVWIGGVRNGGGDCIIPPRPCGPQVEAVP